MMRISTVTMFEQSLTSMNRQQSEFLRVGQQIASGRRVVTPADDPQASSRAVRVSQSQAITQQNTDSRVSARNTLAQTESVLSESSDVIIRAKTLLIQAANDPLSDDDRVAVAAELRGLFETLVGQANATDGNGTYLFGGYQDEGPPFIRSASTAVGMTAVEYRGDNHVREQRIDASRILPVTENGQMLFQSVTTGSKYVARAEKAATAADIAVGTQQGFVRNEGAVTFSGPTRVDATDPDFGKSFTLEFLNGTTLDATGLIGDGPVTDASGNLTPAFAPGALADSTALVTALEATDQIDAVVDVNGDGSELQITYAATTPEDFTFTLESTNSTLTNTNGAQVRAVADDGTVVLDTTTYEAGATLAFGGVSITLDGEPAIGDEIQIRPADADAANQDLFKTLKDAIDVLELDQEDLDANYAHVRNTISSTMRELDNGLDNLLTRRASVGARLNELDIVDSASGSRAMSYDKTMSDLIDLDYGEAVTEYSLRQVGLQAAQRAYVDIQGMSLFDFMR